MAISIIRACLRSTRRAIDLFRKNLDVLRDDGDTVYAMSKMHQMQLTYVPMEDRMLFRVNTQTGQEFRFWMTRRYVELLFRALAKLIADQLPKEKEPETAELPSTPPMEESAPPAEGPKEDWKHAMEAESRHRRQVNKANFTDAYQEGADCPLGEQPVLLFQLAIRKGDMGQQLLCMHPKVGGGIELALNDQIVHSLCKLLAETSGKAAWNLDLRLIRPNPGTEEKTGLN